MFEVKPRTGNVRGLTSNIEQYKMLTLKEVKSILREQGVRPNKRLGQNFLVDANIQKKIIDAIGINKDDAVIEIGPGLGALTGELCRRARDVIAIEKDRRLYDFLLKNSSSDNLRLVHNDILKYNLGEHAKVKVVGNLPYYISSPILTRLLKNRDAATSIFITVQKEFAERIVAAPGTKTYGSISCFVQFYAEPRILFNIKKNAFYPAPKVDSCFMKIGARKQGLYLTDEEKLFKIIRTSFGKRRKTILNSLNSGGLFRSRDGVLAALEKAGISPARRPETMSLEEFVKLANAGGGKNGERE